MTTKKSPIELRTQKTAKILVFLLAGLIFASQNSFSRPCKRCCQQGCKTGKTSQTTAKNCTNFSIKNLAPGKGKKISTALANELLQHYDDELMSARLYRELGKLFSAPPFNNIPFSADHHREIFAALLKHHSVTIPKPRRDGFLYAGTAKKYAAMLKEGSSARSTSFAIGMRNETNDIASLTKLLTAAKAADAEEIQLASAAIRAASQRHLSAFTRHHNR